MIYGQDEPMLFPVADLYDSAMMQMYINAAREQYNQNREDMKEFRKLYGDFTSPFAEDIAWVDQQTRGRVNDALNYMQANGIDPLRSAEGRALIQQIINNTDTAGINLRKQAAANKILWDKSIADLRAKNLYNKDFVDWDFARRHGVAPDQWSTEKNGLWTDTSADPYQDLNAATKSWYDQMEKGYLYTDDDGYEWWGNSEDDVRNVAKQHLPDLTSPYWQYQKYIAGLMAGPGASDEDIQKQFEDNLVAAASEVYTRPERKESLDRQRAETLKYNNAAEKFKTNENIRQYEAEQAIAHRYAADQNLDGIVDEEEAADYGNALKASYTGSGSQSNSSSSTGKGVATATAEAMGTATQLDVQQIMNQAINKQDFILAYNISSRNAYLLQKQLYDKLSAADKKIAVQYGKDYRTLMDKNATREQKEAAQKRLNIHNNKKDPNFINWKNQFIKRMDNYSFDAELEWNNRNTTEGLAGYKSQTPEQLYSRSKQIFENNNIIPDFTDQQKLELNKQLGYINNEDGIRTGVMRKNRDFEPIVVAEMTGNRRYRYNQIPNVVSRIIKNKKYTIQNDDVVNRQYGAGGINIPGRKLERRYNTITEIATFDDPDVVSKLNNISESELRKYGIIKVDKNTYKIPIVTKLGHGQGTADVNEQSIKRRQGASGAAKVDATTQAAELTANAYGQ